MTTLTVYTPNLGDITSLRGRVRPVDASEWLLMGMPWDKQLDLGLREGHFMRCLRDEYGTTLCVWGVRETDLEGTGQAFFIAATDAVPLWRTIHRHYTKEVAQLHALYPRLVAFSLYRNDLHHTWMRAVGFVMRGTFRLEPMWVPYHLFERTP